MKNLDTVDCLEKKLLLEKDIWKPALDVIEQVIKVYTKLLKIDTSSWSTKKVKISNIDEYEVRKSPCWNILEIAEWEFEWNQLFTWDAAIQEAEKRGMMLFPNNNILIESVLREMQEKIFPGRCHGWGRWLGNQGNLLTIWSWKKDEELSSCIYLENSKWKKPFVLWDDKNNYNSVILTKKII